MWATQGVGRKSSANPVEWHGHRPSRQASNASLFVHSLQKSRTAGLNQVNSLTSSSKKTQSCSHALGILHSSVRTNKEQLNPLVLDRREIITNILSESFIPRCHECIIAFVPLNS